MPSGFSLVRVLTVVFGLFFIYVAAFLYETTEHRIQNKLEELWLKLEYGPSTATGLAERLARAVLNLMDGIFDRVFGTSELSIRTLAVASCYVHGAMAMSSIPWLSFLAWVGQVNLDPFFNRLPMTARGYAVVGLAAFAIGTFRQPARPSAGSRIWPRF